MHKVILIVLCAAALTGCVAHDYDKDYARAEHACAELGLTPGSARHSDCVVNLNTSMMTLHRS